MQSAELIRLVDGTRSCRKDSSAYQDPPTDRCPGAEARAKLFLLNLERGVGEEKRRKHIFTATHKPVKKSVKIKQFPRNSAQFLSATKYHSHPKQPGLSWLNRTV